MDWHHLLERYGANWRVLYCHLVLFGYDYPGERDKIPAWIMRELSGRLLAEVRTPPMDERLCQGTLVSREQFLPDIEQWGYRTRACPQASCRPKISSTGRTPSRERAADQRAPAFRDSSLLSWHAILTAMAVCPAATPAERQENSLVSSVTPALPHWDMSVVFPSLQLPAFRRGASSVWRRRLPRWARSSTSERAKSPIRDGGRRDGARRGDGHRALQRRPLRGADAWGLTSAFVATKSRDNPAQARQSELQRQTVKLSQLATRFTAGVGAVDVDAIQRSGVASDDAYMLRRARIAKHAT